MGKGEGVDTCGGCDSTEAAPACKMARTGTGNNFLCFAIGKGSATQSAPYVRKSNGQCECGADQCLMPNGDHEICRDLKSAFPYGPMKHSDGKCGCSADPNFVALLSLVGSVAFISPRTTLLATTDVLPTVLANAKLTCALLRITQRTVPFNARMLRRMPHTRGRLEPSSVSANQVPANSLTVYARSALLFQDIVRPNVTSHPPRRWTVSNSAAPRSSTSRWCVPPLKGSFSL